MALRKTPHPEEAAKQLSRRTHGADPADRQFPYSLGSRGPLLRGTNFSSIGKVMRLFGKLGAVEGWVPACDLNGFYFVVPAQAGTQGFQSLALGPRLRGGDDLRGLRDFITASCAGKTSNGLRGRGTHTPISSHARKRGSRACPEKGAVAAVFGAPGFPPSRLGRNCRLAGSVPCVLRDSRCAASSE
jgi:hypothetical protein